jgi:hypothetical protein
MPAANYSRAFTALFLGPRVEDCDNIVKTLADHYSICHDRPTKEGRYILEELCEDFLADRVEELAGDALPDDYEDRDLTLDEWDRIVRAYCFAIKFEANDDQVKNLIEFFGTYLYE